MTLSDFVKFYKRLYLKKNAFKNFTLSTRKFLNMFFSQMLEKPVL